MTMGESGHTQTRPMEIVFEKLICMIIKGRLAHTFTTLMLLPFLSLEYCDQMDHLAHSKQAQMASSPRPDQVAECLDLKRLS